MPRCSTGGWSTITRVARGPKHPETLTAINNLGTLLQTEKKYAEAERLFRECLELSREVRGPAHPGTIGLLHNLGFVLADLGRDEEAEKLIRQTLELTRQVLGPEHPLTLGTMRDLGIPPEQAGSARRCREAAPWVFLEAQRRVLGPNNPETLETAARLDALIKERSRHAEEKPSAAPDASKR